MGQLGSLAGTEKSNVRDKHIGYNKEQFKGIASHRTRQFFCFFTFKAGEGQGQGQNGLSSLRIRLFFQISQKEGEQKGREAVALSLKQSNCV